ncbi:hypothetical protein NNC19_20570 [Clostridium sp. SHJSY1]|uniref:hypothetical protein n=1 Tax=Clostridium sp. SHJSY1 TaxID=2942483 RepID=UPI0028754555|nr:hypothetical protein [Clostridium sp. SHJSY1]MDS0528093.1 hypothetical protein [Clostridium sp. SHJSY1]
MENFIEINNYELETINGGDLIDLGLGVGGMFCPPLGLLGIYKTWADWLDSQTW